MTKAIKSSFHVAVFVIFLTVFLFALAGMSYAQTPGNVGTTVPEPATMALISTSGLFGYIIRFARKRFHEFKRCFDVVVSVIGLIVTAPIVTITAIFIKIVSPGSVFFMQKRVGLSGNIFYMYKMRTMQLDAEAQTGPVWAQEDDPRLIPFGRLIRKSHIDELPQFFNVLRGEMSIVGPRPERPVFVDSLSREISQYEKRLDVKPGITGLAQVWHKYDETVKDVKKKIKLDLLYIRKMCLWVDMRILASTVLVVLTGRGAR